MALISYEDLRAKAVEMLKDNDDLFVAMVGELDSYNGYADGFRAYPMDEIDDLFYGVKIGDFLDKLTDDFKHTDDYFYETIYGLDSTNSIVDLYHDNVDEDDLLEQLIEYYPHISFECYDDGSELEEMVTALDEEAEFYEEELGYYTAVDDEE